MTWQKESTGLFVNLFPSPQLQDLELEYDSRTIYEHHARHPKKKCSSMAENDRKEGNLFFAQSDWNMAIVKYNRGLWFAEKDSEQMGLLYANRSACFMKLKMYDKCVIDIGLATATINFPQRIMAKLHARKQECLDLMAVGVKAECEPKLSFESSTEYPGMANVLKVDGGQIKTTRNLHAGETVLIEEFYFSDSYIEECSTCFICQKHHMNLVPCNDCTLALICHDCKYRDLHRFECSVREFSGYTFDREIQTVQKPIIRSIVLALQSFRNCDDLMVFVEDAIANGLETLSLSDEKSKYRSFLTLSASSNEIELIWIFRIYKVLLQIPEIAAYFPGEKHRRFLMHLIQHHIGIFLRNFLIDSVVGGPVPIYFTCGMACLAPRFNHSCTPNTILYIDHGFIIGKVIQPIKSGEQLSTVNTPALHWSLQETKDYLSRINGIHCQCKAPPIFYEVNLGFDGNFQLLSDSITRSSDYDQDQPLRKVLFNRVFTKFGHGMWTSKFMKVLLDYYIEMHKRISVITSIRRDFKNKGAIAKPEFNFDCDAEVV